MGGLKRPRPLTKEDDRTVFDCGQGALNGWFQRHAWRNHHSDASRVSVVEDPKTGSVVGYVALSAGQIERGWLPKARQRNMPDPVPMILLGQLAVDLNWQGRGVSRLLMAHAFASALHVSKTVGSYALVTHPLNDDARRFYVRWGLSDLAGDPKGAMFIRIVDLEKSDGSI